MGLKDLRIRFFLVIFPLLLGNTLKFPYEYRLYQYYGFHPYLSIVLMVYGLLGSAICDMVPHGPRYPIGTRNVCLFSLVLFCLSSYLRLSDSFPILSAGRLLEALADALAIPAAESWYIHEHLAARQLYRDTIFKTLNAVSNLRGIAGIVSGLATSLLIDHYKISPKIPFYLSAVCFSLSFMLMVLLWRNNSGVVENNRGSFKGTIRACYRYNVALVLIANSLVESSSLALLICWAPVLDELGVNFGLFFSVSVAVRMVVSLYQDFSRTLEAIASVTKISTFSCAFSLVTSGLALYVSSSSYFFKWFVCGAMVLFRFFSSITLMQMSVFKCLVIPMEYFENAGKIYGILTKAFTCVVVVLLAHDLWDGYHLIFFFYSGALLLACLLCYEINNKVTPLKCKVVKIFYRFKINEF